MLPNCNKVCAAHPWLREVWLFDPAVRPSGLIEDPVLLVVCRGSSRSVPPGQRKRLLAELETLTGRRLDLQLAAPHQLSAWLSRTRRFAAAFSTAARLYPQEG